MCLCLEFFLESSYQDLFLSEKLRFCIENKVAIETLIKFIAKQDGQSDMIKLELKPDSPLPDYRSLLILGENGCGS